jgi:hypothetical protein
VWRRIFQECLFGQCSFAKKVFTAR